MYIPQVEFNYAREKLPNGTNTIGVVVGVYHLGTQLDSYEGKESKKDVCYIEFELFRTMSNGSRFLIGKQLGTNLGKANPKKGQKSFLRKLAFACLGYEPEDGKFTPWQLLGKSCQIQIGETQGGNQKIEAVTCLSDGQSSLTPQKELVAWSILDPNCRQFDNELQDWLLEKAKNCLELKEKVPAAPSTQAPNSQVWAPQPQDDLQTFQAKAAARGVNMEPVDPDETPF